MALSLDYIGKLTIILIVVAVSIGMIVEFRDQIENTTPTTGQPDEDPGLEIVQVEGNSVTETANLINLCYQRSLEQGYEDISCFVARKDSGSFDIDSSEIEEQLEDDVAEATQFEASTYDRDSIIIQYRTRPEKVVVEK